MDINEIREAYKSSNEWEMFETLLEKIDSLEIENKMLSTEKDDVSAELGATQDESYSLEEKLKASEMDNETMQTEKDGLEQDRDSLQYQLDESESEGYAARKELEEYESIDLTSADDKMRWDKTIELFPKLTWNTLKMIEDS